MIRLQIGNSIFSCDTPEEAVRIHRLAGGVGGATPQQPNASQQTSPKANGQRGRGLDLIKKLSPHVGKELTSEELAKIVGAKGANGLGPKIHQLRLMLEKESVVLDDYIERRKADAVSPTTWFIKAAA